MHGVVLDLGCGDEKIVPYAVGVDLGGEGADIHLNMNAPNALGLFNNNAVDVVFSSHMLEDIFDYKSTLREMWRVLKPHGHLILYLPHKDFYPNIGQPGANVNHQHDFYPDDILNALGEFASYKLIRNDSHNEDDEYSFELIVEKLDLSGAKVTFYAPDVPKSPSTLIIRYGALGDMLIMAPVARILHEQGYNVYVNCTPDGVEAMRNNPYVDGYVLFNPKAIPQNQLEKLVDSNLFVQLERKYDKLVNLCWSMETTLLFEKRNPCLWYLPHEVRDSIASVNYVDKVLEMAGLEERGLRPEIYLSETEEALGRYLRKKYEGRFILLWQLAGTSDHKIYPYLDLVVERLALTYPDMVIFLSGWKMQTSVDMLCGDIIPNVKNRVGQWSVRTSLVLAKYMDLVVGPETAVLQAAGCWDVPKIVMLTHSNKENFTKYFTNDFSMQSKAECSPCHRLTHDKADCPCDPHFGFPICMSQGFDPNEVERQIVMVYEKWKRGEIVRNDL
jgi:ADP-heptose:LPS heptosyltransferase